MRAWFTKTLASIVMMMLSAGYSSAEPTLTEVLRDYDDPKSSADQRKTITSNLASIETALGWANTALRVQHMQKGLYCLPNDLMIEPQELIDMLRDALWDEPRLGGLPIGFAVLATLQRAFPCK